MNESQKKEKEARQKKSTVCVTPFICDSRRYKLIQRQKAAPGLEEDDRESVILTVVMPIGIRIVHFKSGQFTAGQLHLKNLEKQKPPPLSVLHLRPHFLSNLFQKGSCPHRPQDQQSSASCGSRNTSLSWSSPWPPALGHPRLFLPKYTDVFQ